MLHVVFTQLTQALENGVWIASAAAVIWGVLSILLSPCHLASIPLIVGFISGQGTSLSTRRALMLSSVFSAGLFITIALTGLLTAAAGKMLGDLGPWTNYAVAAVFFIVGLHMLGVIPLPWSGPVPVGITRKGLLAALILGLFFGIALGPCTFAFMAPLLALTFRVASENWLYAAILLMLYGAGHCSVIVAAGTFSQWVQRYLNWTSTSRPAAIFRMACGILVIAGGLYLLFTAQSW